MLFLSCIFLTNCATVVPFNPKNVPSKDEIEKIPDLSKKYFDGNEIFISLEYDLEKKAISKLSVISRNYTDILLRSPQLHKKLEEFCVPNCTQAVQMSDEICLIYDKIRDYKYSYFDLNIEMKQIVRMEIYKNALKNLEKQNSYLTQDYLILSNNDTIEMFSLLGKNSTSLVNKRTANYNTVLNPIAWTFFIISAPVLSLGEDGRESLSEFFVKYVYDDAKTTILKNMLVKYIYVELQKLESLKKDILAYNIDIESHLPNLLLEGGFYKNYLDNIIRQAIQSADENKLKKIHLILNKISTKTNEKYNLAGAYQFDVQYNKVKQDTFDKLLNDL